MTKLATPVVVNGQHHVIMATRDVVDLVRENCGDDLASLVEELLEEKTEIAAIREQFDEVDSQLEDVIDAFNQLRQVLEGENA